MRWTLQLPGNDFSVYNFASDSGEYFTCKHNPSQGSFRLKAGEHHGVFYVDEQQLINRKITLANPYGSEIATITKNIWKENTGIVVFDHSAEKIAYLVDAHASTIEVTKGDQMHICDLNKVSHPGRELHFIPVIIALSWLQSLNMVVREKSLIS